MESSRAVMVSLPSNDQVGSASWRPHSFLRQFFFYVARQSNHLIVGIASHATGSRTFSVLLDPMVV